MLEALKFVHRGVAKRDSLPPLMHFAIRGGRVTGYNGSLALSAPLQVSFEAAPLAGPFVKALDACDGAVSIAKESATKIIVRSGKFKAEVPCVDPASVPVVVPEGVSVPAAGLVAAFMQLRPFICSDTIRQVLCGILLTGESAYATNNIVLVQQWLGTPFPFLVNIPVEVVDEVIRIKDEPSTLQITTSSISFHYSDGRWIRSQLSTLDWPDVASTLNHAWEGCALQPVSKELKAACAKLAVFAGREQGQTFFRGQDVATARANSGNGIACVEVPVPKQGCYYTKFLANVLDVADSADFSRYPNPVPFANATLRGVILGVRE